MTVLSFEKKKQQQGLEKELKEWQTRLRLCYDFNWKDPSRAIIESELKRIKDQLEPNTIIDKIASLV